MSDERDGPVLMTTRPEIPDRRILEVLGVVFGEGDTLLAALTAIEELALDYGADAVVDVRTTAAAASDGYGRAHLRVFVTGTAVNLDPPARTL